MHTPDKPPPGLARWDDVRVFLAVLRRGSFSAAARQLEVEQSTVSRRVLFLEESLGARLFDRLPEGPRPTALSHRLREHAELIEAQVLDFGDFARSDDQSVEGNVTLALTDSFAVHVVIPHVLGPLRARHPKLRMHLIGSDQSADLSRREADLALRFYRPTSGDLVSKRVARLPVCVLAHKRYAKSCGRDPERLDWIVSQLPGAPSPEQLYLRHLDVVPSLIVSSHLAQVEAVRAGLGVALLTRSVCRLDRNLVELSVGFPSGPAVELWLVAMRTLRNVPRISAVWQLLEEGLAQLDDA